MKKPIVSHKIRRSIRESVGTSVRRIIRRSTLPVTINGQKVVKARSLSTMQRRLIKDIRSIVSEALTV